MVALGSDPAAAPVFVLVDNQLEQILTQAEQLQAVQVQAAGAESRRLEEGRAAALMRADRVLWPLNVYDRVYEIHKLQFHVEACQKRLKQIRADAALR